MRSFAWHLPRDEWDAISLNYTSGTTGNPKGVVYHHRGAYLNAITNILSWGMPPHAVYLWTLPMFHCNGWCFPWTMAANAGTNVCLRRVDAKMIFDLIREHRVTHYCGAPIVHNTLINAPAEWQQGIAHTVNGLVAGAAPPGAVIEGMQKMGFNLTHVYGLTETYGPAAVCAKHPEWDALPLAEQVRLNGRQGVWYHLQQGMTVMDPATMQPVPWDGETMGEIMFRGNITMKGYLKNPTATNEAFAGGWFHSGDLAVMQPDGYVKIKDRSKDVIISGGENISSLEVEDVLYRHPAVLTAAVVAQAGPEMGRDAVRIRRTQGRCAADGAGDHRVLPGAHGAFQGAEDGDFRSAAQDLDRQDPEVRAARAGEVGLGDRMKAFVTEGTEFTEEKQTKTNYRTCFFAFLCELCDLCG